MTKGKNMAIRICTRCSYRYETAFEPLIGECPRCEYKYERNSFDAAEGLIMTKGKNIMRQVEIGTSNFTNIVCLDEIGSGGACHEYEVLPVTFNGIDPSTPVAKVSFQDGPVKESGINGCHQEDLIAIVIDRLQYFQKGGYACRENAIAITKLEEAMHWLNHRTADRVKRGVEGTHEK